VERGGEATKCIGRKNSSVKNKLGGKEIQENGAVYLDEGNMVSVERVSCWVLVVFMRVIKGEEGGGKSKKSVTGSDKPSITSQMREP